MTGRGRIVLVGTPIGNLGDLPPRAVAALREADVIACEDTRHTRKLLSAAGVQAPKLLAVHDHNESAMVRTILGHVEAGRTVALVTDAGMPGIADPGGRVVAAAAAQNVTIDVVPGPSAAVTALVVSGLDTQRFCFEGFLPRKGPERRARLHAVATDARTTVLYEAPHRLRPTVADLAEACGPLRKVTVARELTKLHEEVWRGTLGGAVEHLSTHEPRGEYVVVVAGAPPVAGPDDDDVRAALAQRLASGKRTKEAAEDVASALGVSRRRAYDLALVLRGKAGAVVADGTGDAGVGEGGHAVAPDAGDDV